MPHINIKAYPGRSEEKKKELAEKIKQDVVDIFGCKAGAVSVLIEELSPEEFSLALKNDIQGRENLLYVKPDDKN